jgi:thiamine biosynthesis lipoprotein
MLDLLFPDDPVPPSELSLLRANREAMATSFEVVLPAAIPDATLLANEALDLVDEFEAQLTVYTDHSEVSRMNATAPRHAVVLERRLFELLRQSAEIGLDTGGCFDIATGALIKAWGFYRRQGRVPTVRERAEAMSQTGMRHVILDDANRSVRYLRPRLEINLGAIGKGYTLDRVAEWLRERGVTSALLHGGSSSVLAVGRPATGVPGWSVALLHPWRREQSLGTVRLRDDALGTSAATFQFFEYNGRKLGHLLDPRTGWPAEKLAQVSVIAPTAAEADALSTALFVMGLEAAREYCRTHPHVGAILLTNGPDSRPETINLTGERFVANSEL